MQCLTVSTHSHPKVAAFWSWRISWKHRSFNTQPPEGGCMEIDYLNNTLEMFQHTATRRWLQKSCWKSDEIHSFNTQPPEGGCSQIPDCNDVLHDVSTHSHPKVAAVYSFASAANAVSFNTQPPEGGCSLHKKARKISKLNTVFR